MLDLRNTNLKFNQDDIGMTRHKTVSSLKDFIFRLGRSEGPVIFILILSSEDTVFLHFWELFQVYSISSQDSMILSTQLLKSPKLSNDKSIPIKKQETLYSTIIWVLLPGPIELLTSYLFSSSQLRLLTRLSLSLNMVPALMRIK